MGLLEELRSASNETVTGVVERLVDAGAREDDRLDYKQALTVQTEEQKLELARDVSAFANARGGVLVYGVRERRENGESTGEPDALTALSGVNPDKVERQLLDILDANLQPRAPGVTVRIGSVTNGHVLVVGVPRSWCGPHMVKNGTFWVRQGARKRQFDVAELRASFVGAEELDARIRRFRDERLGRIIAADTPSRLTPGPVVVLHVVPVASVEGRFAADLAWAAENTPKLWPSRALAQDWRSRFNLDGFVTSLTPGDKEAMEYTLMFRSGAIEYVDAYVLSVPRIGGLFVETRILAAARTLTSALVEQSAPAPFALLASLYGVAGRELVEGDGARQPWEQPRTFDRDMVVLPDVLLREQDWGAIEQVLKPAFDALWQAAGWPRSAGYDANGAFLRARHKEA